MGRLVRVHRRLDLESHGWVAADWPIRHHVDVDPLQLACLRLSTDDQPSEDLPAIATDALVRGIDSPYLRRAAGASASDVREARDLFVIALEELGYSAPAEQEALWRLVRDACERIVAGELDPYTGARRIWRWRYRMEREGDLRIFVGLASEWEDHPEHRATLDERIIDAARQLLVRRQLRRWLKLMARYGADPLTVHSWTTGPRVSQLSAPVNPVDLLISPSLAADVRSWANNFDVAMDRTSPPTKRFASSAEAIAFVDRGAALVRRLQAELGDEWHVEYMPTPTHFA